METSVHVGEHNSMPSAVDLAKLFFAVCVIAIHVDLVSLFPDRAGWYVEHMLFRLAVPFFFVCTGFFHGKKFLPVANTPQAMGVCVAYCRRNLPAFLLWSAVGLITYAFNAIASGRQPLEVALLLIRTAIFYPRGAMWFVLASMLAVLMIGALWRKRGLLMFIAIAGYTFALLCNNYYFIIDGTPAGNLAMTFVRIFVSARNFLGVGLLQVGLGMWLSSSSCPISKWDRRAVLLALLACSVILLLEVSYTYGKPFLDDGSLFVSMPIIAILVLELCLRLRMPYSRAVSQEMRKLSGDLYYLHPPINQTAGEAIMALSGSVALRFLTVLALCSLVCIVVRRCGNEVVRRFIP